MWKKKTMNKWVGWNQIKYNFQFIFANKQTNDQQMCSHWEFYVKQIVRFPKDSELLISLRRFIEITLMTATKSNYDIVKPQ